MTRTFRLSEQQWVAMQVAAGVAGVPVSAWLRQAVADKLAADEQGSGGVPREVLGDNPADVRTQALAALARSEQQVQRSVSDPDALAVRAAELAEERRQRWLARQPKKA